MIVRNGFVSNSSSTSFIITNKAPGSKTLREFVIENIYLVEQWNKEYHYSNTEEEVIRSAESYSGYYENLQPGENVVVFGDEDGTILGRMYDYMLRNGGESRSFKWKFKESLR